MFLVKGGLSSWGDGSFCVVTKSLRSLNVVKCLAPLIYESQTNAAIYVSACWIAAIFKPCIHLSGGPHKLDTCHWLKPLCQLKRTLYSDAKGLKWRSVMESAHKSKQKCLCEVQMLDQNWSTRDESPQLQPHMALHMHMHKSCFKPFEQHWFDVFSQPDTHIQLKTKQDPSVKDASSALLATAIC